VYAALSPYLNGVRRTSNAAAAAQAQAAAAATSAAAAQAAATARAEAAAAVTAPAAAPFLNPAIPQIADATTFGALDTSPVTTVNPNTVAPPAPSATDSVLHGDGAELVQSYGAVALLTGPLAAAQVYGLPAAPAVPAVAPVSAYPRTARIDNAA
jgi:hypothetical protein